MIANNIKKPNKINGLQLASQTIVRDYRPNQYDEPGARGVCVLGGGGGGLVRQQAAIPDARWPDGPMPEQKNGREVPATLLLFWCC